MVIKKSGTSDTKLYIGCGALIVIIIVSIIGLTMIDNRTNVQSCGAQTENASLTGTLTAYSTLYSDTGNILWRERKDDWLLSPIDSGSGQVIGDLRIALDIDIFGKVIDWDSFYIYGALQYNRYAGNGGSKEWTGTAAIIGENTFNVNSSSEHQTGMLQFDPLNIMSLIPDTISVTYREYDEVTGRKTTITETFPQKEGDHPIQMTFTASYHLHFILEDEVFDQYFVQTFNLSFFWGTPVTPPPESHAPYISSLADTSAQEGEVVTFQWTAGDIDMDYDYYTITIDDEEVFTSGWNGGIVGYGCKFTQGGEVRVTCTVYDLAGNSASDTVNVDVYETTQNPPALPDYRTDTLEVDTEFTREIDPISSDRLVAANPFGLPITAEQGAIILIGTTVLGIIAIAIVVIYYPSWLGGKKD